MRTPLHINNVVRKRRKQDKESEREKRKNTKKELQKLLCGRRRFHYKIQAQGLVVVIHSVEDII